MEYLLDRNIKLNKSKYENLYDWNLQEYDKSGQEVGAPRIPVELNFYFTSTKISYHHTLSVLTNESEGEKINDSIDYEHIKVELESGSIRENEKGQSYIFDNLRYSFFGTERAINNFHMIIGKLEGKQDKEAASVYGIPSYKIGDYDERFTEDALEIKLLLKESRFTNLVEQIKNKTISYIEFNAIFPGFYYEWSPSTFLGSYLDEIKILAEDEECQIVDVSKELDITPIRLGKLNEFSITEVSPTIENHVFLNMIKNETIDSEDYDTNDVDSVVTREDNQLLNISSDTLKKIQKPLWLIALLLLLILFQSK